LNVIKRYSLTILLIIVTLAGCDQLPTDSSDQDVLATAVAATVAAAPSEETPSETAAPEATEKSIPASPNEQEPLPGLSMQDYLLAYTNEGNLWTLSPDGSSQQLSSSGNVVGVLLSDDRSLIVYVRQSFQPDLFEVRAINTDGSNDQPILTQDTLDALYPLNGALHYLTSQMEFIPGTHSLLFNTRAVFDGPGLVKNDDLFRLDVDTAELIQLIDRERAGDFTISPDGEKLAISRADSIAISSIDGSELRDGLVNFQPITTYSEYQYYPPLVWSPDSSRVGVFIPSSDPLADDPSGTVWIVPVDGVPQSFPPISGQVFFPQSSGRSLLSSDLQTIAFLSSGDQGQTDVLNLANVDGSNSRAYDRGDIQWFGWSPDGRHFAFRRDDIRFALGNPDANPQPLTEGRSLRWLTEELYLAQSGLPGEWTIKLGHVDGQSKELVQPSGDVLVYDLR
jgi:hypothetical protein